MSSLSLPEFAPSTRLLSRVFTHEEPPCPLVFDLGEVKVLTADGLGQLVALHTRLRSSGGHLVLCNVGESAYEALAVTGLTELLEVRRAREEEVRTGR